MSQDGSNVYSQENGFDRVKDTVGLIPERRLLSYNYYRMINIPKGYTPFKATSYQCDKSYVLVRNGYSNRPKAKKVFLTHYQTKGATTMQPITDEWAFLFKERGAGTSQSMCSADFQSFAGSTANHYDTMMSLSKVEENN